jgi:hypothetical protein
LTLLWLLLFAFDVPPISPRRDSMVEVKRG